MMPTQLDNRCYTHSIILILCIGLLAFTLGFAQANTYQLAITEKSIQLIDQPQNAIVVNDGLPAPTLRWQEGEHVTLLVTNLLKEQSSIHWHGIVLPYQMDGVPGISFSGIAPGETFSYQFQVNQNGTYWYHGHSGMQEQQGLFGAIIIDPKPILPVVDHDYVVMLSDWPEADPHRTLNRLKIQSDYYNFQKRTVGDFFTDVGRIGLWDTLANRLAWGQMRMEPTDLADVTGATYHFLVNGQTPAMHQTYLFQPGEKLRLRFINASAMTHFDVRIPGLKMRVIAADGQPVNPVDIEEFRIAVAETYDVLVEPQTEQAFSIFAEAMDRSGYAHASLTSRVDKLAEIPPLRPRTLLTMADMGGDHAGHSLHSMPVETTANHQHTQPDQASHAAHTAHMTHTDHQAMMSTSEDASAIGSHQVLSYEHLKATEAQHRLMGEPNREITLRLTGNMYRYIWSFDDVKYSDAEPIRVKFGERIRFHYVNETMMNHPIHLHGLWQYLDNGNGMFNPKKHVINVKPGQTVSVDVPADAAGEWAFHCHLLYHMDTGMFRKLIVEKDEQQHD
jgi:CopA family copper-resistance protein